MYLIQASKTSLPPGVIRGRALSHRHLSASQRAAIAAQLQAGEVTIEMTSAQLARLLGVSAPYIDAARQLSPEVRRAIADGEGSLSCLPFLFEGVRRTA
jgi:hypothetical protein